jgi:hypothetical protein
MVHSLRFVLHFSNLKSQNKMQPNIKLLLMFNTTNTIDVYTNISKTLYQVKHLKMHFDPNIPSHCSLSIFFKTLSQPDKILGLVRFFKVFYAHQGCNSMMDRKLRTAAFETEFFCKIIHFFTVTFDQFTASLLIISIIFLQQKEQ